MIHTRKLNWAVTGENVPSDLCAQRKFKSICATAQSDHSHRFPHDKKCILGYPKCTQRRFWSDCVNAQADLNEYLLAHKSKATFPDVAVQLFVFFNGLLLRQEAISKSELILSELYTFTFIKQVVYVSWQNNFCNNPFKPSAPLKGHWQSLETDQTLQNAASDQGLHCLH